MTILKLLQATINMMAVTSAREEAQPITLGPRTQRSVGRERLQERGKIEAYYCHKLSII